MGSHAQVGQKMLVPVPPLSPSSCSNGGPEVKVDSTGSKQCQTTDCQAQRVEQNRCAKAVELAVRTSERRLQEELMHHCASTWCLQARAASTLMRAEKVLQESCEQQRQSLQRRHAKEMAELAAKMQVTRSMVPVRVSAADSSQLDPEDDVWMEAMQHLVDDLQRENRELHSAV